MALPAEAAAALQVLQARVDAAADPKAEAAKRWESKPAAAFGAVRGALDQMAQGRSRCMYCEDSAGTDIEHFWPKAAYPGRAFRWDNYLLACSGCNSNQKRDQFPLDGAGAPLLLDPSDPQTDPADHLLLVPTTGRFAGQSPRGEATIEVLDLNCTRRRDRLPQGRREALNCLQLLIVDYHRAMLDGDDDRAALYKRAILHEPFPAVRDHLLRTAAGPGSITLRVGVPEAIAAHGISAW